MLVCPELIEETGQFRKYVLVNRAKKFKNSRINLLPTTKWGNQAC